MGGLANETARSLQHLAAADYDRLCRWTLNDSGPMRRQQAIDVLVSAPFSAVKRDREPKE
jgi:hypothetical protein